MRKQRKLVITGLLTMMLLSGCGNTPAQTAVVVVNGYCEIYQRTLLTKDVIDILKEPAAIALANNEQYYLENCKK